MPRMMRYYYIMHALYDLSISMIFFIFFEMVIETYIKKYKGDKQKELKGKASHQKHKTITGIQGLYRKIHSQKTHPSYKIIALRFEDLPIPCLAKVPTNPFAERTTRIKDTFKDEVKVKISLK